MARGQSNPAPGFRNYAEGDLTDVGNRGYSWSSTANNTNGMYLDFSATVLYPSYANFHAHGFQLRCLSEETVPSGTPK